MPKNNNFIPIQSIEKQKLVEEIRELTETPWWQEYQSQVGKSPLSPAARGKIISKSGSDYVSENKWGYGPMPSDNDDILIIAGSQSIMNKIRRDFPNVATLLDWNRNLTLGFLDKKGALSLYRGTDAFRVPCSHSDNYSKTGPAAWQEYRKKIKEYVDNISSRGNASRYHEVLAPAREVLVGYIHEEYYKVLPCWPDVGQTNTRSFEANIGSSYNHGTSSQVVWNCMGWIEVTDKRPASDIFEASFRGSPEIKLLILNLDKLKEIEDFVQVRGIESAKDHIKNRQPTYQITWEDL
ncbi:MAG: hypothetical protein I3273_00775 [Candidatus Moeniiplasma glomeromycotorum]|nr:hypothetical protein [Candidatus Moeniiplasma glomeromycotorum]MCE8167343.1 hypothetical protein [Candidatus Moeniiplasma glomeromycotorum]MCE8168644.1 hypothetical protein [Candidatus Moeniiplasma glomeromycotorum]